jgi:hypothetical protein
MLETGILLKIGIVIKVNNSFQIEQPVAKSIADIV